MEFFSFEQVLLRLKQALRLKADKDVAEALGMEPSAFNKRKARGSFPEKELYALAAAKPELELDVVYVLKGERTTPWARLALAKQGQTVSNLDSPDLADMHDQVLQKNANVAASRRVEIEGINEALFLCSDGDFALLKAIALRFAAVNCVDRCVAAQGD